jgi:hypothetical protein
MASKVTMGCISMKSIRSSIISLVHVTCIHQNFLHRVYTNLNSSFLEWRLGCKTCIVYTGLYSRFSQQCFSTCIHVSPNNVSLPVFTFLPTMFLYLYSRFSQQCFSTCIHVSPKHCWEKRE